MKRLVLLFGLMVLPATAVMACPIPVTDDSHKARSADHMLSLKTTPAKIRVGQAFTALLTICDHFDTPFAGDVKVDAEMPMHKHGMNYRPSVTPLGMGRFKVQGMLFHMPGVWQFRFDLRGTQGADRINFTYRLDP